MIKLCILRFLACKRSNGVFLKQIENIKTYFVGHTPTQEENHSC